MKRPFSTGGTLAFLSLLAVALTAADTPGGKTSSGTESLMTTIVALDTAVFDAYNRCDMKTFGAYFTPDVEFYHDKSGLMTSRQSVIESTEKYICGKSRRELIEGTLQVYPIKDYGAIEIGEHRFCQLASGKCEGVGKFVNIWQNRNGTWQMSRVISYDHHAAP